MAPNVLTVNDFLGRPNPKIEQCRVIGGENTSHERWDPIEGIRPLKGFTYSNLYQTYKEDLKKPMQSYADIDLDKLVSRGRLNRISNEDTITFMMPVCVILPVNLALSKTTESLHIGAGSLFHADLEAGSPDMGIGNLPESPGQKSASYSPGDLKISSKWTSEGLLDPNLRIHNPDPQLRNQLRPLEQVQNYCRYYQVPWGWILSDKEIVIIRISTSSSTQRPPNPPRGNAHQRALSNTSELSSDMSSMSLDGSIYSSNSLGSSLGPIEICSIPWSASGDKTMTVNRALWYLARLTEERYPISDEYPSLDPKASTPAQSKGPTMAAQKASSSAGSKSKPKAGGSRTTIFVAKKDIALQVMEEDVSLYFEDGMAELSNHEGKEGFRISYRRGSNFFQEFLSYMKKDTESWLGEEVANYVDSAAYKRRQQLGISDL